MLVKLGSEKGDSIAEVLVALLISAIALVMLASMITSSTKLITGSKETVKNYYTAANSINTFTTPAIPADVAAKQRGGSASVSVALSTDADGSPLNGVSKSYPISYYADWVFQNKPVVTFQLKPKAGGT